MSRKTAILIFGLPLFLEQDSVHCKLTSLYISVLASKDFRCCILFEYVANSTKCST